MNNRQEALNEIVRIARLNELSSSEIEAALRDGPSFQTKSSSLAASIFGYIGGILVLGGIIALIHMQWDRLGPLGHILITLIPGFLAFALGVYFTHDKILEKAATPLLLLAAAIEPIGIMIALREYAPGDDPTKSVLLMCFIMVIQQGCVFWARQRTVLAFTSIFFVLSVFATALDLQDLAARYIGMIVGISTLCIAYTLSKGPHRVLAPLAYFCGSVFFLGAYAAWVDKSSGELTFLGVSCLFIYGSVVVRSRILLINSALFMLSYIAYYSSEHFAHIIGWPITLIATGILIIGTGVVVVNLNNKYIRQQRH